MEPNTPPAKKKLLLLIEDNPLLEGMYFSAFQKAGFDVALAHDGETGLQLVKERKPDGIILDLLMPGLDGFGVLERLRGDDKTKDIKTIVLTSVTDKESLDKAKNLGAIDCLVKSEMTLWAIVNKVSDRFL